MTDVTLDGRWLLVGALALASPGQAAVDVPATAARDTARSDTVRADTAIGLSPRGALVRSALLPGWGQVATGHRFKAALFGGAAAGFLTAAVVEGRRVQDAADPEGQAARRNTRVLYYFLTVTLSALDAYVDAHLDDFEIDAGDLESPGLKLTFHFDP